MTTLVTVAAQALNPKRLRVTQADAQKPVYLRLRHPMNAAGATGPAGHLLDAKHNSGELLIDLGDDARWVIEVREHEGAWEVVEDWQELIDAERVTGTPSVPRLL